MASSYESLTFYCSSQEEEFDDADTDYGFDQNEHHPHPQNLSKLSDADHDSVLSMYLPNLSIRSFDGEEGDDADEECGDDGKEVVAADEGSSDESETELGGCNSRYYGSNRKGSEKMRKKKEEEEGKGMMVITRPKGGRRSLCMDMGEVKACQELGFDLEHEGMLQPPPRLSLSGSTLDSPTSGGNSPMSNWRISSPGDDPREVKARLKLWAQAVAMASASKHAT